MKIFIITSIPVNPPWDQGDKNLAHSLTRALPHIQFKILTQKNTAPQPETNLITEPFYQTGNPSVAQKAFISYRLLAHQQVLARSNGAWSTDLYHLIYRPYPVSSTLLRWLPEFHRRATIHTIPATTHPARLTKGLFFARCNVVLSRYGYCRLTALGLENVVHIPPGILIDEWRMERNQVDYYKRQLGLADHPVVLFTGHYGQGMGADMLLRALPQLIRKVPDAIVIFACRYRSPSDLHKEKALKRQVNRLGLIASVRFYNTFSEMKCLIGASDLVTLPLSNLNNKLDIPTTLLEFMAMGKPVVITDIAPMNEIMDGKLGGSKDVGIAVPCGDHNILAESLIQLLLDERLRERQGRCGEEVVRTKYNISHVAKRYETLYRELID